MEAINSVFTTSVNINVRLFANVRLKFYFFAKSTFMQINPISHNKTTSNGSEWCILEVQCHLQKLSFFFDLDHESCNIPCEYGIVPAQTSPKDSTANGAKVKVLLNKSISESNIFQL